MPTLAQAEISGTTSIIIGAVLTACGAIYGLYSKIRADRRADAAEDRAAKAKDAKEESDRKALEEERIRKEIDARLDKQQKDWDHIAELSKSQQDDHLRAREERAAYKARCEWQEARIAELKAENGELQKRLQLVQGTQGPPSPSPVKKAGE